MAQTHQPALTLYSFMDTFQDKYTQGYFTPHQNQAVFWTILKQNMTTNTGHNNSFTKNYQKKLESELCVLWECMLEFIIMVLLSRSYRSSFKTGLYDIPHDHSHRYGKHIQSLQSELRIKHTLVQNNIISRTNIHTTNQISRGCMLQRRFIFYMYHQNHMPIQSGFCSDVGHFSCARA